MTESTLADIRFDPYLVHKYMIEEIEKNASIGDKLVDPTSPFILLLELIAVAHHDIVVEIVSELGRRFPSMATTHNDLFHHLSSRDQVDIFATPAVTNITLYIDKSYHYDVGVIDGNYRHSRLPKNTRVMVDGIPLLIPYSVDISQHMEDQYIENSVFTYTINVDENTINIGDIVSIAKIQIGQTYGDSDGNSWSIVELPVIQANIATYTDVLTSGVFNSIIPYSDSFYMLRVYNLSSSTHNEWVELNVTYSDTVLDLTLPTVKVFVLGGTLELEIHPHYISNGLTGSIMVEIYTTKGEITKYLGKKTVADFTPLYPLTLKNSEEVAFRSIPIMVSSAGLLDGGVNNRDIATIRNKIIGGVTIGANTPITDKQAIEVAKAHGFRVRVGKSNGFNNKVFFLSKANRGVNIDFDRDTTIEFYTARIAIVIANIGSYYGVVSSQNSNVLTITPKAVFKLIGTTLSPITLSEKNTIDHEYNNSTIYENIALNKNYYCFTPYYWVLDPSNISGSIRGRVFDLSSPAITNFNINRAVPTTLPIAKVTVSTCDSGYNITFTLPYIPMYHNLNMSVAIEYNAKNGNRIKLVSSPKSYIDEIDNKTHLLTIATANDVDIDATVSNEGNRIPLLLNAQCYVVNKVGYDEIILSQYYLDVILGVEIKHMYVNAFLNSTDIAFKKYESDITNIYPKKADIICSDTLSVVPIDVTGDGIIDEIYVLLDSNTSVDPNDYETVVTHEAGDIVTDNKGYPMVSMSSGATYYIDIITMDYSLTKSNSMDLDYMEHSIKALRDWAVTDVTALRNNYIENSNIVFYVHNHYSKPVLLSDGSTYLSDVTPEVVIYLDSTRKNKTYQDGDLRKVIGKTLTKYFDMDVIDMAVVKTEILSIFAGQALAVKINLSPNTDKTIYRFKEDTNRFTIKKELVKQKDTSIIYRYLIDIKYEDV